MAYIYIYLFSYIYLNICIDMHTVRHNNPCITNSIIIWLVGDGSDRNLQTSAGFGWPLCRRDCEVRVGSLSPNPSICPAMWTCQWWISLKIYRCFSRKTRKLRLTLQDPWNPFKLAMSKRVWSQSKIWNGPDAVSFIWMSLKNGLKMVCVTKSLVSSCLGHPQSLGP